MWQLSSLLTQRREWDRFPELAKDHLPLLRKAHRMFCAVDGRPKGWCAPGFAAALYHAGGNNAEVIRLLTVRHRLRSCGRSR